MIKKINKTIIKNQVQISLKYNNLPLENNLKKKIIKFNSQILIYNKIYI